MRVLSVRILNLNSLAGEFTIDFTHPAYQGGVFAITGPTGAGKTTVLDAVCLALYGRTPRLARINKSGNEIMSRGRGECAAEVSFETPAGRFRAFWGQRRARLKAGAALQDPHHEVAEAGGRLLESRLSRTGAHVSALTGLTFEQFTRACLLAQGAFAAFLAAPADDKAALLEQITGTTLYRDISIAVHQRRAAERRRLEDLERDGAALAGPPGEDEDVLRRKRGEAALGLETLERDLAEAEKARDRRKTLAGLEEEGARLAAQGAELAEARKKFAPFEARLSLANRALPLAPLGAELNLLREEREKTLRRLAGLGGRAGGATILAELGRELEEARARLDEVLQGRDLAALRAENRAGQFRAAELAGLKRDQAEAGRLRRDRAASLAKLDQTRSRALAAEGETRAAEARLRELAEKSAVLNAALEEARRGQGLAGRRGELSPGRPCPLCGALEHPWAGRGPGPAPDPGEAARGQADLETGRRAATAAAAAAAALNQAVLHLEEQVRNLGLEEERKARDLAGRAAAVGLAPDPGAAISPDRLAQAAFNAAEGDRRLGEAEKLAGTAEKLALKINDFKAALDRAAALEEEITRRAAAFNQALNAAGLGGEEAFRQALAPEEERRDLEGRARELSVAAASLAAAQKENADRLLEAGAAPPPPGLPEIEARLAELAAARRELLTALGALDHKLAEAAENRARRLAWQKEAAARREEARRWDALHELIGSADGRKYRAFAQGLTFENLIGQANRQLAALSDRYLLVRDQGSEGLELSVADLWQAGEIRSTKNLSGGETFLVSLALALGLSRLSSRKARVDSLFLDEGFGALDEETLETVLNTLSSLNQEGRLVGVISHVPALCERLATQIRLIPSPGGPFSRLAGPGIA